MKTTVDDWPSRRVWAESLATLYREHYEPMVRIAYLLTGQAEVAEELVQDAFVAVHRNWSRVIKPSAYLRRAVVNACRSWGRRPRMEVQRRPGPAEPASLVADEMWDTLQRLPARQRAAIVLRFYEDLPDGEIAGLLGCRPATVRTSIHRALIVLRKEIRP